jgi:uncharacterized protein
MGAAPEFTEQQADYLSRFLSAPARPKGTMQYEELAGFLFALSSVAEMIPPNEWLPVVFNESEAGYANTEESSRFLETLMALHTWIAEGVSTGHCELPASCTPRSNPVANFGPEAPLGRWARGFVAGHQWMESWWPDDLPQDQAEELSALLVILPFFSSREFASSYVEAMGQGQSMEELAAHMLKMFPDAMEAYVTLGAVISPKEGDSEGTVQGGKTGRNDPCPCGSGKKYKKCCGLH